jgi:hypothetical protein
MSRSANGWGDPTHQAARVCGYRWTDEIPCTTEGEHMCWRTSPEHRTHICTCEAIDLRPTVDAPIASAL